jgi:RNA polymerase sigma-70 factor (ECF subfamily)
MEAGKPVIVAGAAMPSEDDPSSSAAIESPEITALVLRAKEGSADAFSDLMRLHERRIISLGRQLGLGPDDALDACQDTFIKVFKYIGRFESGRPFFKWLYRIAIHVVYDHLRRARGAPTVSLEDLDAGRAAQSLEGEGPSLHSRVEAAQMAERVRKSLDCLSPRERIVFVLRDLQDLSTEEIGNILGLSQVTIRRHCMAARQKMRQHLLPSQR